MPVSLHKFVYTFRMFLNSARRCKFLYSPIPFHLSGGSVRLPIVVTTFISKPTSIYVSVLVDNGLL